MSFRSIFFIAASLVFLPFGVSVTINGYDITTPVKFYILVSLIVSLYADWYYP